MPFNVEEAKKHGYTEEEIAAHLAKRHNFNVEKAKKSGYSTIDIISHLSKKDFPAKLEAPKAPTMAGQALGAYQKYAAPTLEGLGLGAGAVAGSPVGPMGSVAGAGLGYAVAKKVNEIVIRYLQRLDGIKRQGGTVPEELYKSLVDVSNGMTMEMSGQSAGTIVGGIVNKALSPYATKVSLFPPGKKEVLTPRQKYSLDIAKKYGVKLSPGETTELPSQQIVEYMMGKSPMSADLWHDWRLKNQIFPFLRERENILASGKYSPDDVAMLGQKIKAEVGDYLKKHTELKGEALNKVRSELVAQIGSRDGFEGLGMSTQQVLDTQSARATAIKNRLYQEVTDAMPQGQNYDAPNLKKTAKEILRRKERLPAQDPEMISHLRWASGEQRLQPKIQKQLDELPEAVRDQILADMMKENPELFSRKLSYQTLSDYRLDAKAIARGQDEAMKRGALYGLKMQTTPKGQVFTELNKAALKDMQLIVEQDGGQALEKLKVADLFYGKLNKVFRNKQIQRLAYARPKEIIDIAFTPGGVYEAKVLRAAVGDRQFRNLRGGFANKLLGVEKHETFNPQFLKSQIEKYGDALLNEVYGKQTTKMLRNVANTGIDITKSKLPQNAFLKSIAEHYPDTVVDRIIGAPESKLQSNILYQNLAVLKKILPKDSYKALGDSIVDKMLSLNQDTMLFEPVKFSNMYNKYMRRGILKKFLPHDKVEHLGELANIASRLKTAEQVAGNPSGTGQTIIAWGTMGMIFRNPIKGTVVAVSPRLMTKLWQSDLGMKYLTEGFKTSANSGKGTEIATKIAAILAGREEEQ